MKKMLCILLSVLLMLSFCACEREDDDRDDHLPAFEDILKEMENPATAEKIPEEPAVEAETSKAEGDNAEVPTKETETPKAEGSNTDTPAQNAEKTGAEKRLTRMECYDGSGNLQYTKEYKYNHKGQLVGIGDQVLTYDNHGNLLWQVSGTPVDQVRFGHNTGVRYQYDAQNRMISRYTWEGSATEETYEYDASGKLAKSYSKSDYLSTETSYQYDNQGFLVKKVTTGEYMTGEKYSETVEITNDERGRPTEEEFTVDGEYDEKIVYDHDLEIFVIKEFRDENGRSSVVELYNAAGQRLDVPATFGVPSEWNSTGNYLQNIQDKNSDYSIKREYRFFYEDAR